MSGLLFLTSSDFTLQKGIKGKIMCTSIPGFSLILFYSTQCQHCKTFVPMFKKLPGTLGGCQFGMVNVSHNKNCILMSRQTTAPITVVPYVILYVNGKPYMRYQGPQDIREITRFIIEISKSINNKNKSANNNKAAMKLEKRIKRSAKGNIPAYCLGHPLCGPDDKVCYLEFNDAYDKKKDMRDSHAVNQRLSTRSGM